VSRVGWLLAATGIAAAIASGAKAKASQRWLWPVPECFRTSSLWGMRPNPFPAETAANECHRGLDIPCRGGSPIVASRAGTVVTSRMTTRGGGLMVEIAHPNGCLSRYMHMSALGASVGQFVDAGQQIGNVGTTGRSTGNHLHFEVRDPQGRDIDPGPLLGVAAGKPC